MRIRIFLLLTFCVYLACQNPNNKPLNFEVHGIDAVSYTHLDVYKRQVQKFDFNLIQNWSAYWFVLVGVLVTSLIQSSSATVAITLAALSQGILTFDKSAAIVIGSELGTSLKFLLGAFNGSADKKRLALGNTLFNLAILVLSMLLLYPILRFIQFSLHIQDPLIGLASFQTGINLMGTILVLPFIKRISGWLESKYANEEIDSALHYPNPVSYTHLDVYKRQKLYR